MVNKWSSICRDDIKISSSLPFISKRSIQRHSFSYLFNYAPINLQKKYFSGTFPNHTPNISEISTFIFKVRVFYFSKYQIKFRYICSTEAYACKQVNHFAQDFVNTIKKSRTITKSTNWKAKTPGKAPPLKSQLK